MILCRGLGNHWASQTATQPRLVTRATSSLRGNPRNESNREYNTGSREIVSYNNALVSHPRIRNYSAKPMSAAGILYRSRIESFPRYAAFPSPPRRPNILIHGNGIDLTRGTELTRSRNESPSRRGALRGISRCRKSFPSFETVSFSCYLLYRAYFI